MKKAIAALAAGVFAVGVSAQAAEVESAEYAVITIPVTEGYNLIGISVEASNASLASVISGLSSTAAVKTYTGSGYSDSTVGALSVSKGDSFFVNASSATNAYEIGVAPSESAAVEKTLSTKMAVVAPPFADEWSLNDLTFSTAGGNRFAVANQVHVWNGTGYDVYWYKKTTSGGSWKNKVSANSVPDSFGAGQSFFVVLGNGTSTAPESGTLTFAAPSVSND